MDQATILRKLTGIKRLEQAFSLSDLVREISLKNINSTKNLTKKQALRELSKRLELSQQ